MADAATPTIDPDGGSFVTLVHVTLACETPDSTIYYTTDGSTPDATDTEYTAPFTISGTVTVKAIATAAGFTPSAVASADFVGSTMPYILAHYRKMFYTSRYKYLYLDGYMW